MYTGKETICVVGLGYIGLPTASLLGTKGFHVHGVDISKDVVDIINQGKIHIVEPDLDILVKSAVQSGKLTASLQPTEADIFIIAVPTPFKDGYQPDLSYVERATRTIAPYVRPGNLVILESTSPPGTTEEVVGEQLRQAGIDIDTSVYVAHCPERVLPGKILRELIENDRIVGGLNDASTNKAVEFYKTFINGEVLATDARTAEMAKLAENTYRDINIAYANELSMICDQEGINVFEMIRMANRHPRVNILSPGPGVGGHCIAVDPWFIVARAPEKARLIRTAREVNNYKPKWVLERVAMKAEKFKRPVIGCLGISFKADVDDIRESPALEIVHELMQMNLGEVLINDPNIKKCNGLELIDYEDVLERSDILLLLVDHKQYKKLRATDLKEKILIDTRGAVL
ncbi:MAG: UDP-N-acetyl-D-mannosamine dehydrogenase [Gammaproteobacteria bacterium]|nr:UDP-N-acetyl-D-mannosamine dehydrogenase [Gammaproteobacteria bacterium]